MLEYQWIRSNRKTIAIQIKEDGQVIVRTPYRTSKEQTEAFVHEKKDWILKHLEQIAKRKDSQYVITDEARKRGIELAMKVLPDRAAYYAKKMQVSYGRITIREQKTRWGSCSSKRNLNFNWKLVLMPEEILDYVVVHELAHRKEMNHSAAFWKVVEAELPDYKQRRRWLKENGNKYT